MSEEKSTTLQSNIWNLFTPLLPKKLDPKSFFFGILTALAIVVAFAFTLPRWINQVGGPFVLMSTYERDSLKSAIAEWKAYALALQKREDALSEKNAATAAKLSRRADQQRLCAQWSKEIHDKELQLENVNKKRVEDVTLSASTIAYPVDEKAKLEKDEGSRSPFIDADDAQIGALKQSLDALNARIAQNCNLSQ